MLQRMRTIFMKFFSNRHFYGYFVPFIMKYRHVFTVPMLYCTSKYIASIHSNQMIRIMLLFFNTFFEGQPNNLHL